MVDSVDLIKRYDALLSNLAPFLESQKKPAMIDTLLPIIVSVLIGLFSLYSSYSIVRYKVDELKTCSREQAVVIEELKEKQHKNQIEIIKNHGTLEHVEDKLKKIEDCTYSIKN